MPISTMTIMGTGTSVGVPMAGCECEVCLSTNPKNHRYRSGVLVRAPRGNFLIDTGPELRLQLVREKIRWIHAVLFTHAHADHILGLDDLRIFGFRLEHQGSTAALVGDTLPCAGVDELASGADVYVQTVIRRDIVEKFRNAMMLDILDYHSGVVDAAQTAARVGAKRLAMTHLVPAPTPEQYPEWVARAAEHYDGQIIIGDDLTTIEV